MKPISQMLQAELAAYVCSKLKEEDIDVILSGGAAAAIYSEGKYTSLDIDFIPYRPLPTKKLASIMGSLGFSRDGRYYKHKETSFFIEFPPGPPAVGSDFIEEFNEISLNTGILKLLSVTDSVKDRLSAYYHWDDEQSLETAIAIAKGNEINIEHLTAWSRKENKSSEFKIFLGRIRD